MKATEVTDLNRLYEIVVVPKHSAWAQDIVGTIVRPTGERVLGVPHFEAVRWSIASGYSSAPGDDNLFFGDVTLRPLTHRERKKYDTLSTKSQTE